MNNELNDIYDKGAKIMQAKKYRFTITKSIGIILWQLTFSTISIYLSFSDNIVIWISGQILLSINMLQWFFLMHELAHQSLFPNEKVNAIIGHVASLFCLIPFFPWDNIHQSHHKWTGWREFDPTIPDITFEELKPHQISIINFCWKFWIPIFAINYTIQTFYSLNKLNKLYPKANQKINNVFSISFIVIVYLTAAIVLGFLFLKIWLLAFFIFVSISDPMLLSQHTHLDYNDINTDQIKPVKFIEQPLYTRSVRYPFFIEKYLFYFSSRHGLHHQFPWVPFYYLNQVADTEENTIFWTDWVRVAKSIPAHKLIFQSFKDTGIKL